MLSDCSKCWETPCECGHGYKDWSKVRLEKHIAMLRSVLATKQVEAKADEPVSIGGAFFGSHGWDD